MVQFGETENCEPGAQEVAHHCSDHLCRAKTSSIAMRQFPFLDRFFGFPSFYPYW